MVRETVAAITNQFATNSIRFREGSATPDDSPIPADGNTIRSLMAMPANS
jgi:hypothetical protein